MDQKFFFTVYGKPKKKKPQEIIKQPAAVKSNKQKAKTKKKRKHIVDEIEWPTMNWFLQTLKAYCEMMLDDFDVGSTY